MKKSALFLGIFLLIWFCGPIYSLAIDEEGKSGQGVEPVLKKRAREEGTEMDRKAGAKPPKKEMYKFEYDTDRYGEDYRDFDIPVPDPALCAEACANEAECKAWTMVKPGVQGGLAKCWLKSAVPQPTKDECCISGVKGR